MGLDFACSPLFHSYDQLENIVEAIHAFVMNRKFFHGQIVQALRFIIFTGHKHFFLVPPNSGIKTQGQLRRFYRAEQLPHKKIIFFQEFRDFEARSLRPFDVASGRGEERFHFFRNDDFFLNIFLRRNDPSEFALKPIELLSSRQTRGKKATRVTFIFVLPFLSFPKTLPYIYDKRPIIGLVITFNAHNLSDTTKSNRIFRV